MKTIGNILWVLCGGIFMALVWVLIGVLLMITIIGIPFGIQCFKFADYALHPFGYTYIRETGAGRTVMNIIWIFTFGIPLFFAFIVAGLTYCCMILTIPFGVACFKYAVFAFMPFGCRIVTQEEKNARFGIGAAPATTVTTTTTTVVGMPMGANGMMNGQPGQLTYTSTQQQAIGYAGYSAAGQPYAQQGYGYSNEVKPPLPSASYANSTNSYEAVPDVGYGSAGSYTAFEQPGSSYGSSSNLYGSQAETGYSAYEKSGYGTSSQNGYPIAAGVSSSGCESSEFYGSLYAGSAGSSGASSYYGSSASSYSNSYDSGYGSSSYESSGYDSNYGSGSSDSYSGSSTPSW